MVGCSHLTGEKSEVQRGKHLFLGNTARQLWSQEAAQILADVVQCTFVLKVESLDSWQPVPDFLCHVRHLPVLPEFRFS